MDIKSRVNIGGVFKYEIVRGTEWDEDGNVIKEGKVIDEWEEHNIMTNEGLDYVLDVAAVNGTQIATWYVAPFKGNYTPTGAETGASVATDSTEATEYSEAVRQTYVPAAVSGQSTDNTASKASFTINGTVSIYGAFLSGDSAKSGTGSKCLCISRFPAKRDLIATDILNVTYTLSAQDVV